MNLSAHHRQQFDDNGLVLYQMDVPVGYLPITRHERILRYVVSSVTYLVHLWVVAVVLLSRQLHAPRHIFWLGVSIVVLVAQTHWLFLMFAKDNESLCAVYVTGTGLWFTTILVWLTLAGLDRYVAITRHEWYARKVTCTKVVLAMIVTGLVNGAAVTSPYWTLTKSVFTCTLNLEHMNWVFAWIIVICSVNVVLHVKIFTVSRRAIREYFKHKVPRQQSTTHITIDGQESSASSSHRQCFPWPHPRSRASRLDFRAALYMSINVLPLWLCTFPFAFDVIAIYWSVRLQLNWTLPFQLHPYLRGLFNAYGIYSPLVYIMSSGEFKRAVLHLLHKVKSKSSKMPSSQQL